MIRFRFSFLREDQGVDELVVNDFELTRTLNSYVGQHGPLHLLEVKEQATENYRMALGPNEDETDVAAGKRRWRRAKGSDGDWTEVPAEGAPEPGDWDLTVVEPPHPRNIYEQTRTDRMVADLTLKARKKEGGYEEDVPEPEPESKPRTINGRMELINPDGTFPSTLVERFGEEELRRAVEEDRRPPERPRNKGGFKRYFGINIKLR